VKEVVDPTRPSGNPRSNVNPLTIPLRQQLPSRTQPRSRQRNAAPAGSSRSSFKPSSYSFWRFNHVGGSPERSDDVVVLGLSVGSSSDAVVVETSIANGIKSLVVLPAKTHRKATRHVMSLFSGDSSLSLIFLRGRGLSSGAVGSGRS
jgi:hypothetical protein